jgi:magnesium chelatase subunit H
MKVVVFYVGSSLPAAVRRAERALRVQGAPDLVVACHNATLPMDARAWAAAEADLAEAELVFIAHVTDPDNAARIGVALDRFGRRHRAVIVFNSITELMRRTRLGAYQPFAARGSGPAARLVAQLGSWIITYARSRRRGGGGRPERYLELIEQVSRAAAWLPARGRLGEAKRYVQLYNYFLQPAPENVGSMLALAISSYVPGYERLRVSPAVSYPATGIYHPDAPALFPTFESYRAWYPGTLDRERTVGLLLMRPQVVSGACGHYDGLIRALEAEGLSTMPVLSTLMDNRTACDRFFVEPETRAPRVSQIVSLTGFSFVGGPAMNDSEAAGEYLKRLNRPLRSAVSLEMQRVEDWQESRTGLNPVQTAMQVAIPEIDGATEPFVYGGTPRGADEPAPLAERCRRIARRLARWERLRRLPRDQVRLAFVVYSFPPDKGNVGTAADLDVFPSLWQTFRRLEAEGYRVDVPESSEALRNRLLEGMATGPRLAADEYYRLCPYVEEIEAEWGPAPGTINADGRDIVIQGIELGNVFVGVQPTFGYEGDPMRMMMAQGGTPHHGFMAFYLYLDRIFRADAVVHVGTHGALEFMPGKQAGLSARCWPDRLIGELPNVYLYSVNNPSEGSIAKRRSYATLISYLTPPLENAGLYRDLASLKELIRSYRETVEPQQRERLFAAISETAARLHLDADRPKLFPMRSPR